MSSLLCVDPAARLSAEQVLSHEWLAQIERTGSPEPLTCSPRTSPASGNSASSSASASASGHSAQDAVRVKTLLAEFNLRRMKAADGSHAVLLKSCAVFAAERAEVLELEDEHSWLGMADNALRIITDPLADAAEALADSVSSLWSAATAVVRPVAVSGRRRWSV